MPSIIPGPWGQYLTTEDPDIYAYGRPTPWGPLRSVEVRHRRHREREYIRRWDVPEWSDDEDDDSDYDDRRHRYRTPYNVFEGPTFLGPNEFDRTNVNMMPGMHYPRGRRRHHNRRPHGEYHWADFGRGHRHGRNRSRSRRRRYNFDPGDYDFQWPAARWDRGPWRAYHRRNRHDTSDEDDDSDDSEDERRERRRLEGPTNQMRMLTGNADGVTGFGLPTRRERQRANDYDYTW